MLVAPQLAGLRELRGDLRNLALLVFDLLRDVLDLPLEHSDRVGHLVDPARRHRGRARVGRTVCLAALFLVEVCGLLALQDADHVVNGTDDLVEVPTGPQRSGQRREASIVAGRRSRPELLESAARRGADRALTQLQQGPGLVLRLVGLLEQISRVVAAQNGDRLADGGQLPGAQLLAVLPLGPLVHQRLLHLLDVAGVILHLQLEVVDLLRGLHPGHPLGTILQVHSLQRLLGGTILLVLVAHELVKQGLGLLLLLRGLRQVVRERLQQLREHALDLAGAGLVVGLEGGLAVQLLPIVDWHLCGQEPPEEEGVALGQHLLPELHSPREGGCLAVARREAAGSLAPQPEQRALLVPFRGRPQDLHRVVQGRDSLVHLLLGLGVVLVLPRPRPGGDLDVAGERLNLLLQVPTLRRELDAACVEIGDVGLEHVDPARGCGIGLGLLAYDALCPAHVGLIEVLLLLRLLLNVSAQALQQLRHARDRAERAR
mmetsp:Transcript_103481/g.267645  ORF Transcript_103481/g.267645 Transcript_103481/m.267645 type:complete len:488 (-) Transcript_103481:113-1576(-)